MIYSYKKRTVHAAEQILREILFQLPQRNQDKMGFILCFYFYKIQATFYIEDFTEDDFDVSSVNPEKSIARAIHVFGLRVHNKKAGRIIMIWLARQQEYARAGRILSVYQEIIWQDSQDA